MDIKVKLTEKPVSVDFASTNHIVTEINGKLYRVAVSEIIDAYDVSRGYRIHFENDQKIIQKWNSTTSAWENTGSIEDL